MDFNKVLIIAGLIIAFLSSLWFVIAALFEERIPNSLAPPKREGVYVFDYVVVGAGSAGSVVASLISKHSNATVLLVEAGDRFGLLSKIPLLTTLQQKGINDWGFLSVPQKYSSKGLVDQRQCLPRGKGLGGSSQLNYMLHHQGHEKDFERWSNAYNLTDWQYSDIRPFLEAGNAKPYERFEIPADYSKITKALHQAQMEFMHKPWHFRRTQYNIKNGLRYGVFQRFIQPAFKQKNLKIMTNARAKQIEFQGVEGQPQNNGVKVKSLKISFKDEKTHKEHIMEVKILQELIISAGAYQSPQVLMVSGLGKRQELTKMGISVPSFLPELPYVGLNLHDHINYPLYVSIKEVGPTLNQNALLDPWSLFKYLTAGTGHLGNFGVVGHLDHLTSGDNLTDVYGITFFAAGAIEESALMSISNFRTSHFRATFPLYHNASQEGMVMVSSCLQPKSRGWVKIQSPNVRKYPLINPRYLAEQQDIACLIKAIRTAVEVATSDAFSVLQTQIHWPRIKECSNFGPFERDFRFNQPSDHYLKCVIEHVGLGSHHPGGSCAMGTSPRNSVVNSQFKVHGISNLRVIDASVLPTPLSGNPNSAIVAMAVRGSTMILKDYLKNLALKEKN